MSDGYRYEVGRMWNDTILALGEVLLSQHVPAIIEKKHGNICQCNEVSEAGT
jgi:hypothetical protein